nr:MAG TPA: hypothetical protein [Caudoviricetes sp.]
MLFSDKIPIFVLRYIFYWKRETLTVRHRTTLCGPMLLHIRFRPVLYA